MEVETLDSLEGLDVVAPASAAAIRDRSAALRLACAAAAGPVAPGSAAAESAAATATLARRGVPWIFAAAVLLVALAWGVLDDRAPASAPSPPAPPTTSELTPETTRQPKDIALPPVEPLGERAAEPAPVPAATAGRGSMRISPRAAIPEGAAAKDTPTAETPARSMPLDDPVPQVNLIFVEADRRLAVLDGTIVSEGERVGRRIVQRIESKAVVLREPSGHELRVAIRRR